MGTVLSQLISGLLNTWWLLSKIELIEIRRTDFALSRFHIRQLCVIGLPMGFEYSVSAIGAVIMQNAINLLGSVAIAAQTAGEKIRQMFTLPMERRRYGDGYLRRAELRRRTDRPDQKAGLRMVF